MIHFVGAGCGAADLITVRGKALLEQADVIIYAGSLVNPALLAYKKDGCRVYDSAKMTLEEVLAVMLEGEAAGLSIVRLHTGDPCLYGAMPPSSTRPAGPTRRPSCAPCPPWPSAPGRTASPRSPSSSWATR